MNHELWQAISLLLIVFGMGSVLVAGQLTHGEGKVKYIALFAFGGLAMWAAGAGIALYGLDQALTVLKASP